MSSRKQKDRLAVLTTPLGTDVLVATGLESFEALSQSFEFRVAAESDQTSIDLAKLLGKNCAVKVVSYSKDRYFNGIVVEAQAIGATKTDSAYSLLLRPWFWLLTHTKNYKIFANMTAPDIIADIFNDRGFNDFTKKLSENYPKMEYCVQYDESDYDFISRLMERFGIHYFYEHAESSHTLVMVDSTSGYTDLGLEVAWRPENPVAGVSKEFFRSVRSERRLCTGKISLTDYDFLAPDADLKTSESSTETYSHAKLEIYEFPGKYPRGGPTEKKKQDDGSALAKVRLAAHQVEDHRRYADGDAIPLFPGATFKVTKHDEAGKYLVVENKTSVTQQNYASGSEEASERCKTDVVLQPSDTVFRPPAVTPRPVIHGPQTARVIGKSGEEIDVDEYGRVLLRFFWDRDAKSSRRVRVAQLWSSAKWGGQFIPRIDQEVVVEFLDGDPDRPLIVGTVYNDKMKLPYVLPDNQTMAGIKSNSSKGGNGYNEFVFEDKKNSEFVRLHAQRDHKVTVLNTETWEIGESFKTDRGDASRTTTLKHGDDVLEVEKGDRNVTIDEGDHKTVVSQGDQTISITLGSQSVEAMQKIELKVGENSLTIDQTGITIQGIMITLKADAIMQSSAPIVQVSANGMLTLSGALTMIN